MGFTVFNLPIYVLGELFPEHGVGRRGGHRLRDRCLGRPGQQPEDLERRALVYQELDADSMFGQFVDSDFGDGRTDTKGIVFRAPTPRCVTSPYRRRTS